MAQNSTEKKKKVSKAQIAATVKYEKTAYDKILLRIEKEADDAEENPNDGRTGRHDRKAEFPTKAQIEEAVARRKAAGVKDESLNKYILGAVKQRIQREAPDILSPKDPLQDAADAIDGSNLIPGGGYEKPPTKSEAIINDPCINDIV